MLSLTIIAAAIVFSVYFLRRRRRTSNCPPGPPRLPLIGNLHQAPKDGAWRTFHTWIQQYGPLVSADFGGTNVIIIGDYKTASDLLDKRANIYSSRPRMVMAQELVCKDMHIMFRPFDAEFLHHQRLTAGFFSPRASGCYIPVQDSESKTLLKNLLDSGGANFPKYTEIYTSSVIYTLAFGFRIVSGQEWQLLAAHEALKNFTYAGQVGAWIVDALPFLNYLPAPLAPWKKTAEKWYQHWADLFMANMRHGLEQPGWNWSKEIAHTKEAQDLSDVEISWDLGIAADAGIETTNVQLQIFVLACLAYPEFVTEARQELDKVVGLDRLPSFEDLESLPYLQAVVEETLRWRHIVPGGIPHATSKDDYYKGYFIPKGSLVIQNFYSMRMDENMFDAPLEFRPERWLGKSQPNNFGYGRRVCPGRFIAKNSLHLVIARMLWAFDIRSPDGKKPEVMEDSFTAGFVSAPKPFDAVFEPRSEKHRSVVEKEFNTADKDVTSLLNKVRKMQVEVGLSPAA